MVGTSEGQTSYIPAGNSRGTSPAAYVTAVPKRNINLKLVNPQDYSALSTSQSVKEKPRKKGGRQMFDKNELRKKHRNKFIKAIAEYRISGLDKFARQVNTDGGVGCLCYLRSRPLNEKEIRDEEYNVISFPKTKDGGHPKTVVIHRCLTGADLFTPFITNMGYACDVAFDETVDNEIIFQTVVHRLLVQAASGGNATLFMLGQTGSGKTYTMSYIQERVALMLRPGGDSTMVLIEYFEIQGNAVVDLLSETGAEAELRINEEGAFEVIGTSMAQVENSEEMLAIMEMAADRRTTRSTHYNSTSSRSHAVCRITCVDKSNGTRGKLLLVDMAGTERRKDTAMHDSAAINETAKINESWFKLKECIRARANALNQGKSPSSVYMPVRGNPLTKLLSESLLGENTMLSAIGCVSPCATDIDHTISTLNTVFALSARPDSGFAEENIPAGKG